MVLEPSYHTKKIFIKKLLAIKGKRTKIIRSKPVYSELFLLETSTIAMHEFCYDYIKQKYAEKAKLCYMDTNNFIVYVNTSDIFNNIDRANIW